MEGDELIADLRFTGAPRMRVIDDLLDKQYFYLDFYGLEGPTVDDDRDLPSRFVFHVKRKYYPSHKVLRYIFYARSDLRFHVETLREGFFRVRARPIELQPLDTTRVADSGFPRKVIVIDPGHGGKPTDPIKSMGARTSKPIDGRHYYEKDVALEISKRLQRLIDSSPNMRAYMTRTEDVYVSLADRIRLANEAEGDLFVSIHLNGTSSKSKTARGFEIYYLSDGRKETNRQLEAQENDEHIYMEQDVSTREDIREILQGLLSDKLRERQGESADLAVEIDREFRREGPFRAHHRGVKSAAFRVLMNFNMPAVLVECGFLDNDAEAREMIEPQVQDRMAALIFNGINRYLAREDPDFVPYRAP